MSNKPKILIASDHGGYALKSVLLAHLQNNTDWEFVDKGCHSESSVDYPDYAALVASEVSKGIAPLGILICGTGIGMALTANKFKGVRASVVGDLYSARMTREHNDLNILCLGARVIGPGVAIDIVDLFLKTPFAAGRHLVRLDKITTIEDQNLK